MKTFWTLCLLVLACAVMAQPAHDAYRALGIDAPTTTQAQQPLKANEAFALKAQVQKGAVVLAWHVAPGYYLYQQHLHWQLQPKGKAQLGPVTMPQAQTIDDPFFGKQQVYQHDFRITVPVRGTLAPQAELLVRWRGCSGKICYPPQQKAVDLTGMVTDPLPNKQSVSAQSILGGHHSALWSLLILFGMGLLLSMTPCVLPMVPILAGIIVGQKNLSWWRAFTLACSYVLGMAITYAILGIVIASVGAGVQAAFQLPWVIGLFALLFVVLGLSMFDVFQLRLPGWLQNRLSGAQDKVSSGKYLGVFLMGVLSSLILSPCTSAPLIGVLLYVAQSGQWWFGGIALFIMALGMGIPVLIISMGAGKLLPKTGAWMEQIKYLFGAVFWLVAVYLLSRIVPGPMTVCLVGVVLMVYVILAGLLKHSRWLSAFGSLLLLYGAASMMVGLLGHEKLLAPWRPLAIVIHTSGKPHAAKPEVTSLAQLQQQLAQAKQAKQPVLVDFYADWCVECQRMAAGVFPDPSVQQALAKIKVIKVNVTAYNHDSQALLYHYHVLGLPTLLFIDAQGNLVSRRSGMQDVAQLTQWLHQLQ